MQWVQNYGKRRLCSVIKNQIEPRGEKPSRFLIYVAFGAVLLIECRDFIADVLRSDRFGEPGHYRPHLRGSHRLPP